jgi:hypothetical protein
MLLDHVQDVVVKQPIATNVSGNHYLKTPDDLLVIHFFDKHREETNDSLEERVIRLFQKDRLIMLVQHFFVENVKELSHVPCFILVEHPQHVGRVVLPQLLIIASESVQYQLDLSHVLAVHARLTLLQVF